MIDQTVNGVLFLQPFLSIFGRKKIDSLIDNYESFFLPNRDTGAQLPRYEADNNLKWFLQNKEKRLMQLNQFFEKSNNSKINLYIEDSHLLSSYLDVFFKSYLVRYTDFKHLTAPGWRDRECQSPHPAMGVLADIGIFCGDYISKNNSLLSWSVDFDEFSIKNKSTTAGQIVLYTPSNESPSGVAVALDIRSWIVDLTWEICRNRKNPEFLRSNYFDFISAAINGQYHQKF